MMPTVHIARFLVLLRPTTNTTLTDTQDLGIPVITDFRMPPGMVIAQNA